MQRKKESLVQNICYSTWIYDLAPLYQASIGVDGGALDSGQRPLRLWLHLGLYHEGKSSCEETVGGVHQVVTASYFLHLNKKNKLKTYFLKQSGPSMNPVKYLSPLLIYLNFVLCYIVLFCSHILCILTF